MTLQIIPVVTDPRSIPLYDEDSFQIYKIDNFLTRDECQQLIHEAEPGFRPSRVGAKTGGVELNAEFRNSHTSFLSENSTAPVVVDVHSRLFDLYGSTAYMSDPMQVHRYRAGEKFGEHFDFHNVEQQRERIARQGQRSWTMIIYLDDGCEGGETHFPSIDVTLTPRTGTLVAWNNLHADGTGNELSLHAGTPVISGEKHIISKWFRNKLLP